MSVFPAAIAVMSAAVFFISSFLLAVYEMKIMKRLKERNRPVWEELRWFAGRAKILKFGKYLKQGPFVDRYVAGWRKKYILIRRICLTSWLLVAGFFAAVLCFSG